VLNIWLLLVVVLVDKMLAQVVVLVALELEQDMQ
jgi:hypothetical protein